MVTHVAVRGRRKGSGKCGGAVAAKLASEVTLDLALPLAQYNKGTHWQT